MCVCALLVAALAPCAGARAGLQTPHKTLYNRTTQHTQHTTHTHTHTTHTTHPTLYHQHHRQDVSVVDLTVTLAKPAKYEDLMAALKEASEGERMRGILG